MNYAKVCILKRPGEFDDPLTYLIPEAIRDACKPGQGVKLQLRGSPVTGIIVKTMSQISEKDLKLKEIDAIIPDLHLSPLQIELADRISKYYRCSMLRTLKLMIPLYLWQGKGSRVRSKLDEIEACDMSQFPLKKLSHTLTEDQTAALATIKSSDKPVLLHGITGSGKTEIYLRVILDQISRGKQAILLVPEIALTPQMIDYFKGYFGEHIALFHSKLSSGERLKEWYRAQEGAAPLIIGSRSAVFAPVPNLGVLIMDEEHEWTYKQESSPYYETHYVAEQLHEMTKAHLILGTATPRLETFHKAKEGIYEYIHLPSRVNEGELPKVTVVDLREEFKMKNFSIFSGLLQNKIKDRLEKGEQIILFVNQRGMARAVVCRDCGLSDDCPSCEVSLKLHGGSFGTVARLICHYCDFKKDPELSCIHCSSVNIKQAGLGTERVEDDLAKFFPSARVIRADKDTTSDKLGFAPIYEAFKKGEYDILVGTQMVAKGLDFPNVTLIGLVLADIGLHIPDFRSHERLFHLITQVAGRAGRGKELGEVILQTYQPDHAAIKKAADYAYLEFVEDELSFRKRLKYPPFSKLIKFTIVGADPEKLRKYVETEKETIEDILRMNEIECQVLAAPAMIAKLGGQYYYHLFVRGEKPELLFKHWKLPKGWRVDIDPMHTS